MLKDYILNTKPKLLEQVKLAMRAVPHSNTTNVYYTQLMKKYIFSFNNVILKTIKIIQEKL